MTTIAVRPGVETTSVRGGATTSLRDCGERKAIQAADVDRKGGASRSAQINVLQVDALGALPAALVILMAILAMLGVIANVAMA